MENTQPKEKVEQIHLTPEEREKEIQEILRLANEEKMTLKKIAQVLNLKTGGNVGKKLKRAGYARIGGKYIPIPEEVDENEQSNCEENIDMDKVKDILKMIEDMNNRLTKLEPKDRTGIMVSNEVMNYKAFSIRADESIMNDFDELAKNFSNVSKSYLISIALKEFVSKYSSNNKND